MDSSESGLRIVHVLRAPVGGLFRHVQDLALEQARCGHLVGLIADSSSGGERAAARFDQLAPSLKLGVTRFPMRREPHASDIPALLRVAREFARLKPDVIHGHGSKGGLYARAAPILPGAGSPLRVYTPHGGSFHDQPHHGLYLTVERLAARRTDLLLFESDYIAARYSEGVGDGRALRRIVKNGLYPEEFAPASTRPDAADFIYVGELSCHKGVDTLIEALALLHQDAEAGPRLAIVGSGRQGDKLAALVERLGLTRHIAFYGVLPAREAFALGQIVVAPSRAESLPYIVMEAIAAGKTVIATDVGGVGEIFGPLRERLVPRDHPAALADAMRAALDRDDREAARERSILAAHVARHFSVSRMAELILSAYREALARRSGGALARAAS
jgi:glycosyltransferase involved in cell wall biosynthesis